jgi:hypothetical protein
MNRMFHVEHRSCIRTHLLSSPLRGRTIGYKTTVNWNTIAASVIARSFPPRCSRLSKARSNQSLDRFVSRETYGGRQSYVMSNYRAQARSHKKLPYPLPHMRNQAIARRLYQIQHILKIATLAVIRIGHLAYVQLRRKFHQTPNLRARVGWCAM